ncbi:MAG TPA: hypothetical protein DEB40_02330 [Elusimicrobia bacterium]|nr:hypothetical protein [Elusimicrobiota bacterium]HBT60567.1 hypothetical protein [Elusimicrobiota bacterium]
MRAIKRPLCAALAAVLLAYTPGAGTYEALAQTFKAPAPATRGSIFTAGAAARVQPLSGAMNLGPLPGAGLRLDSALALPGSPSAFVRPALIPASAQTEAAPSARALALPPAEQARSLTPAKAHAAAAVQGSPAAGPALESLADEIARGREAPEGRGIEAPLEAAFSGAGKRRTDDSTTPRVSRLDTWIDRDIERWSPSSTGLLPAEARFERPGPGLPSPQASDQSPRAGPREALRQIGRTLREMMFGDPAFTEATRPYRRQTRWARGVLIAKGSLGTILSFSFGAFIDAALAHAGALALGWFGGLIALTALRVILWKINWVQIERIKVRMRTDFRVKLFGHLQRLPASYAGRGDPAEYSMRLFQDVGRITVKNLEIPLAFPQLLIQLATASAFAFSTSWQLALAIFASIPIVAIMSWRYGNNVARQQEHVAALQADLVRAGEELLASSRVSRADGAEGESKSRYARSTERYENIWIDVAKLDSTYATVRDFLQTIFSELLVLGAGLASFIFLGTPSVGQVMALRGYAGDLRGAATGIFDQYNGSKSAEGGMRRVIELFNAPEAAPDKPGAKEVSGSEVSFQGVSYAIPGKGRILNGIDLSLRPKERLLVLSGDDLARRAMVDLLLRLDSPIGGTVRVGGTDVAELQRASLVGRTSLVHGQALTLPGTLRENLLFGIAGPIPDEKLLEALRAAGAMSLLDMSRMPQGLDTPLGTDGAVLDAEERQRLALARVVLKDPTLLVAEDIGKGLETGRSRLLGRTFEALSKGKTTLVFSELPERGESYDKIAVIEGGIVAEIGTHAELMALGGRYTRLVEAYRASAAASAQP